MHEWEQALKTQGRFVKAQIWMLENWEIEFLLYQFCQKLKGQIPERQFWQKQLPKPILMRFLEIMVFDYKDLVMKYQDKTILPESYDASIYSAHYQYTQKLIETWCSPEIVQIWQWMQNRSLVKPEIAEQPKFWSVYFLSLGYLTPSEVRVLIQALKPIFDDNGEITPLWKPRIATYKAQFSALSNLCEDALYIVLQACLELEPGHGLITLTT
jgi:hypothetical protein